MYDRILLPTDGSAVSENAITHAVEMADRYDADLHALYVVDVDAVAFGLGSEQVDRIKQGHFDEMTELKERADAATGAVADAAAERGIEVAERTRAGTPHVVISNYAQGNGVDHIVMGSHGRAGVKRALLGSVTERVLRSAHLPVTVIPAEGLPEGAD